MSNVGFCFRMNNAATKEEITTKYTKITKGTRVDKSSVSYISFACHEPAGFRSLKSSQENKKWTDCSAEFT